MNRSLPGVYLLDPKKAVIQLLAGRLAGTCKSCGQEFRFPNDLAELLAFQSEMISHPLEHDQSEKTKRRVARVLASLERLVQAGGGSERLAEFLVSRLDELAATGVLTKVRRDG